MLTLASLAKTAKRYALDSSISDEAFLNALLEPLVTAGRVKARGGKDNSFMCIIAAPEGIETLQKAHPDVDIYIAAKDDKLNESAYIVPGLGDAGDRIFGTK